MELMSIGHFIGRKLREPISLKDRIYTHIGVEIYHNDGTADTGPQSDSALYRRGLRKIGDGRRWYHPEPVLFYHREDLEELGILSTYARNTIIALLPDDLATVDETLASGR